MATKKAKQLSAQIILKAASGAAPDSSAAVTAENVRDYLPSTSAAQEMRRAFQEAGFEVGQVVGNSFPVTGSKSAFEKFFKTKLKVDDEKGARSAATEDYELPISKLPEDLRQYVAAVTFSPPPDFGPTNYS